MTKHILITLFFSFITYAIVSSIGQPQHSYSAPNPIAVVD
jgi:hypothetical protein